MSATNPLPLHCGYFREVFDPAEFVAAAQTKLGPHCSKFDLLVGTGVSGALSVGMLALALNKRFVIVRKDKDGSHSMNKYEGMVATGDRWLFVDDFISTGRTFKRCFDVMRGIAMQLEYAGTYEYHDNGNGPRLRWGSPKDYDGHAIALTDSPPVVTNTETF